MTKNENAQSLSRDIATTRQQIGQTLDSIQARLTPQNLINEARDSVMDMTRARVEQASHIAQTTMQSAGSAVTATLTENPLIGAIVGVGLSWFANMDRSGGHTTMDNQAQSPFDTTVQRVQDTAGQVAGQAQQLGNQVSGQAQQLSTQVQQQAQQATGWLQHTLTDNPLLVGAVAVAAGLAIGMAIPGTPQENQLMGETRDNLVQKAQNVAQDTVQKVQSVAQDTVQAATQAASQAASQAAQAAAQSAREQGLTS